MALIEQIAVITRILGHVGLPSEVPSPCRRQTLPVPTVGVSVTVRLVDAIRAIGLCVCREEDRLALLHATLIARGSRETLTDEADRAVVAAHHHAALVALRGESEEERPRLIRPQEE